MCQALLAVVVDVAVVRLVRGLHVRVPSEEGGMRILQLREDGELLLQKSAPTDLVIGL